MKGHTMSKKDYEAIAEVIFRVKEIAWKSDLNSNATCDLIAGSLADVFASDNERFDHERFTDACNVSRTR